MLVWWAGLVSWTGNYTLFVALPVYVYHETNSTLATALSVMANALPAILVGQVAGVLVDRWNYRRTMLVANLLLGVGHPSFLDSVAGSVVVDRTGRFFAVVGRPVSWACRERAAA